MNKFARIDEIPSMTLKNIKATKCYGRTDGQRENSIPTHKHSLRGGGGGGGIITSKMIFLDNIYIKNTYLRKKSLRLRMRVKRGQIGGN